MIPHLLAMTAAHAATASDPMISGNWIIGLLGAIAAGIALVMGKIQGRKEASEERSVSFKPPVPTVNTREEPEYVTLPEFRLQMTRIEGDIDDIKHALDSERGIARTANGNLHKRIDALSEKMGERLGNLEGTLTKVAETTKTLLDLALGKTPPTKR